MSSRRRSTRRSSFDEDFDAFLRASISDEDTSLSKYIKPKTKKSADKPWWQSSQESTSESEPHQDTAFGLGSLGGTQKSFLKPKKPLIPPIQRRSFESPSDVNTKRPEAPEISQLTSGDYLPFQDTATSQSMAHLRRSDVTEQSSKLVTETDEFRESQLSYEPSSATGQETLDEAADKSNFFKNLRGETGPETLDFSQMNRQLDNTEQVSIEEGAPATGDQLLQATAPGNHSPIQEEEEEPELPTQQQQAKPSLLANVSLNDTLDTSLQATTGPTLDTGAMGETTQMDMEAVQKAYKNVHEDIPQETLHRSEVSSGKLRKASQAETSPGQTGEVIPEHKNVSHETDKNIRSVLDEPDTGTKADNELKSVQNSNLAGDQSEQRINSSKQISPTPDIDVESHHSNEGVAATGHSLTLVAQRAVTPSNQMSVWDLQPISPTLDAKVMVLESHDQEQYDDWMRKDETPPTALPSYEEERQSPGKIKRKKSKKSSPSKSATVKIRPQSAGSSTRVLSKTPAASGKPVRPAPDKYDHVKSSGYGSLRGETVRRSRSRSPAKSQRTQESVNAQSKSHLPTESSPKKLIESVESFANFLKKQFVHSSPLTQMQLERQEDSWVDEVKKLPPSPVKKHPVPLVKTIETVLSAPADVEHSKEIALMNEVKEWQQLWREERRLREKVSAELHSLESEKKSQIENMRITYEEKLGNMRRQLHILEARVAAQTDSEKKSDVHAANGLEAKLQEESKMQEKLIAGYQIENERIYNEMKQANIVNKNTEDRLYEQNQKLQSELTSVRQQLERREEEFKSRGIITSVQAQQQIASGAVISTVDSELRSAALGAGRIAELKAQLADAKSELLELSARVNVYIVEKQELESHVKSVIEERDKLREVVLISKQPAEVKVMQERHQEELSILEKKVRWYVDNQKLLDRDTETLRQKNCVINELENQIKQMNNETNRKGSDTARRAKDRAADAKRIKDLERQVKELEAIMRKRNPNSKVEKTPTMKFLEERVASLEEELAGKDDETSRLLRALEQQCNLSKVKYEERIRDLETELTKLNSAPQSRHSTVSSLEREIESNREQHRRRVDELKGIADGLRKELENVRKKANASSVLRISEERQLPSDSSEVISEMRKRLQALANEVATLREEKACLKRETVRLTEEIVYLQSLSAKPGCKSRTVKISSKASGKLEAGINNPVYSPMKHRDYIATEFKDQHISDVIEENKHLLNKVEEIQLFLSQERVNHQKSLAELEHKMRIQEEEHSSQVDILCRQHKLASDALIAKYALQQSETDTTKYKNQIDALESVIKHLREERRQWQLDTEELSSLRIRNLTLESRISQLEDKLEAAREHHTPEMRQFDRLQDKIGRMEERFSDREAELRRIISQNHLTYREDLSAEVSKWKSVVTKKNAEINVFRSELDAILSVLKDLKRQGVTIPIKV